VPLIGARAGNARLDGARAARCCCSLCAGLRLPDDAFVQQRLLGAQRGDQHSNSALPLAYRIAASWGSHEGSMLLWVLMLAGWTAAVACFSAHLPLAWWRACWA
jgi:hypothetical protein